MQATPAGKEWYFREDPIDRRPVPHLVHDFRGEYQRIAMSLMLLRNCGLWLDMGLGKTFISIAYALHRCHYSGARVILIVCPTTVIGNWQDQLEEHIDPKFGAKIIVAHGRKRSRVISEYRCNKKPPLAFMLTSYDSLANTESDLSSIKIDSIILDEASKVKNYETKRTKNVHAFVAKRRPDMRVHLLSGTPSTKGAEGFYSLYELLGPGRSGAQNYVVFKNHYCQTISLLKGITPSKRIVYTRADPVEVRHKWLASNYVPGSNTTYAEAGYRWGDRPGKKIIRVIGCIPKIVGYKNVANLTRVSRQNSYTLYKEDVLTSLPPKTFTTRFIELSSAQKKAFKDFIDTNKVLLESAKFTFQGSNNPHRRLHGIANGYVQEYDRIEYFRSQPKLDELKLILDESGNEKVVVWSPFRPQISKAVEFLKKHDFGVVEMHGGVPAEKRRDVINRFRNDPDVRCCVANPDVAGMGLNLVEATIAVVLTNWYKPDVRKQMIDRLHRIGQTKPVLIIDLIATGSCEPGILNALNSDIDLEGKIIDVRKLMEA